MSCGESDIIYIGSQEVTLDGNIEGALSQIPDLGKLPDTEKLLERFKRYGFFSEDRIIRAEQGARGYGGTEILATGIKSRFLDAIVLVCDGVGTIITTDPGIIYGIGNEQPLIRDTKKIESLTKRLNDEGVHTLEKPGIDQMAGVRMALELGYRRVGVTLAGEEIKKYRQEDSYNTIYTICYYPEAVDSFMDLAFTGEELPDVWRGRKRLKKVHLNVLTAKGKELIDEYMLDRFGKVTPKRQVLAVEDRIFSGV